MIFTIEGYASIFGEKDRGGDIVQKGAFKKCLKELKKQNRTIPLLWEHDSLSPVGYCKDIKEDKKGLWIVCEIFADDIKQAREVFKMAECGALTGFSIGFNSVKHVKEEDQRILKKVDLLEISVVLKPMLDTARIEKVKKEKAK